MKFRRSIALVLAVMMVFASVNFAALGEAFAETAEAEATVIDSGKCGSKVNWTLDSEGTLTLSGTGSTYSFKYEDTNGTIYREVDVDGDGVKERVANPFSSNDNIKEVIVGEGITTLGNHLFYDCEYLVDVKLPGTLKTIGSGAIQKCIALEQVDIPESVTKINTGAFKEDTALKRIVIPESVTTISKELFNECTALEEVVIPETVTSIDGKAFRKCVSLKSIDFPDNLNKLATHTLAYCKSLTEVVIPESVTSIGDYCFYDCDGLIEVRIPDAVQLIDASCFEGCDNLKKVNIPDGITELSEKLFYNCKALKEVEIPESVKSIGNKAFSQCNALEYVELPKALETIGTGAFYGADVLRKITIPEGITEIPKSAFGRCKGLETINIPSSVTSIKAEAFYECVAMKEIVIPEGVEFIGKEAFRECRYIEKMTLPSTLKELDGFALYNLHRLKEIHLPDGLEKMGQYALYGLTDITEVIVPKKITTIEQFAFYGCRSLEHVIFLGDVTTIGENAFAECESLRSISLPKSVTAVGERAFEKCHSLAGITLPTGVKTVEKYTFQDCVALKTVSLPEGMTSIADYAFSNCNQLSSLTVPKSVSQIGAGALPSDTKILCYKGSSAETFAKNTGRRYVYVDGTNDDNLISGSIHQEDAQAEWSIDRISEKMIITWNGKMPNYTASTQPWKDHREYITSVEIFGKVDKLTAYVFSKCDRLKTLTVYNRNCDLSALQLKEGMTICGFSGSTAEAYAEANAYTFIAIDDSHNHTYGQGVEVKPSSCWVRGEEQFTCTICQQVKIEYLPVLEHQYQSRFEPADLTYDGIYEEKCTRCGDVRDSYEIRKVTDFALSKTIYTYNGNVQKPQVSVRDEAGNGLTEGEDYDLQWMSDCKRAGAHSVQVILKGDYEGEYTLSFTIKALNLTGLRLSKETYVYDGKTKKPGITVLCGDEVVLENVTTSNLEGLSITYDSGRKNAGTYDVRVKGSGNYAGEILESFTITPAKITSATLTTTKYTYNGSAKKPTVTVMAGKTKVASKTSKSNANVKITYASGRKNVGTYKVTVKGQGNYKGTFTKTFVINPKGSTVTKVTAAKKAATVKWTKVSTQATGYEIMLATDSKFTKGKKTVKITSYKTTSKKINKLTGKKKYWVRIRTYKTVSGKKYYSAWSKAKTVTTKK